MESLEKEASPPKSQASRRGRARVAKVQEPAEKVATPKPTRALRKIIEKSPLKSSPSHVEAETPKEPQAKKTRGKPER